MPHGVREFAIAVFTILVGALAFTLLVRLVPLGASELWQVIPVGVINAVICGIAFWLGWGGSHVLFRSIVVAIGVFLLYLGLKFVPDTRIAPLAIIVLATSILVAVPRFIGLRPCRLAVDGVPETTMHGRQFSLGDLFLWTTTAALMAAAAHWTDVSSQLRAHDLHVSAIWSGRAAICTLAAMWAMLTLGGRIWLRLALAAGIVAAIDVAMQLSFGGRPSRMFHETAGWVSTTIALSLAFYVLRWRGVRIARNQSIRVVAPAESREALLPASPFDAE